jgi:hypothetical protein
MTTINDDLINRSADIRWPVGFDPAHADLFAHNAVVINAPAKSIWETLTAAAAWPKWYSNASDVVIDDPSGHLGEDASAGTATAISYALTTPGYWSLASAIAPTLSWKKSEWVTQHDT